MKKNLLVVVALLGVLATMSPAVGFCDEPVDATIAGGICNGGSAIAPTVPPLVLSCPVSGGPKCDEKEACRCSAVKNAAGGWESENICVKK